ncbi:MAG: response regulator [Chitinivibrionales bacterium]|nr:response regulator [Chitinivibrionales bacterium]
MIKQPETMHNEISLLARMVEHTPITIVVIEPDGKIRYINLCGEMMLKDERTHLLEANFGDYIMHSGRGMAWEEILRKLNAGEQLETNIAINTREGDERICRLNAFIIVNNDQPDSLVLMLLDVTEEARKTDQVEKTNLEMARMNTELIRSNHELKKLTELKSSFLSIASHELKTPLTSIKGYSDIIMDSMRDKIDASVMRMIENINRAADRLHKVVNNILDITRIEQKRLRLQPEDISLPNIANDALEEMSNMHESRRIEFRRSYDEGMQRFFGDRIRMHQLFTNLFTNAIKFSPDDSRVEVEIHLEERKRFHIIIRDFGIGISKEHQKKVFDPFFEIGNKNQHSTHSTKFMGGGTGLGLSIVRGIVQAHGGKIWVDSEGPIEGDFPGSEFHIVLPLRAIIPGIDDEEEEEDWEDFEGQYGEAYEEENGNVEKKPTLLFIDASQEATEVARMVLESAFEVIVASNAQDGLKLAFEQSPSLILLDSDLPGLDGFRVCRLLRTQDETRNTPITFFSASASEEVVEKSFACGADDYIIKPFGGKELMDKIWRLLMKKKEDSTFK